MSVTLNRREVLKAAFAMSAVPLAVQSAWAARLLRGVRGGAVSVTYGATADQGETDDPLVDATAYAAGTIYAEGAIVSTAGSAPYYYSRSSGNVGNLLSNNTYWMQISNFLYVDDVSGSDANTYNSDP